MRKSTRLSLLAITAILVVYLSGCSGSNDMYSQPIGVDGGWGWLQWVVTQVADLTYWVSTNTGGYYFVGLIVVTLIVRTAGWPIYSKSNAMTLNMQQAQPELDRIKEKYQGKSDENSQKKMQAETVEIYKKYNINPLGCLLPFLQMPIFIAMYQMVRRVPKSVPDEVTGLLAEGSRDYSDLDFSFLWIDNLSDPDPLFILPALVGIIMFFYQRYAMKKPEYMQNKKYPTAKESQTQKTTKMMSYFMVIMLVSIAVSNAGIALYWVIGNSYQFLQTYVNRRQNYKKIQASKDNF